MFIPFGPFQPDIASFKVASSQNIRNVVPRADGYGPFSDLLAFTSALPGPCRGYFYGRKSDGSIEIFATTATRIYLLNKTDFSWTDVSQGATDYPSLSADANWQFAQFGNLVFATQANEVLQVFDMSSSSAFADQAGSPPQAAYIAIVGQFVVLSGLLSAQYRIQWCGLNDPTNWVAGVNQSDFQDFPDGGIVRGVAGGEDGTIFQDAAIRTMIYAPGAPYVFQIDRIAEDLGLFAPYGIIRAGDNIFFPSTRGFMVKKPGRLPEPIGKEKIDRTFFGDIDQGSMQLCIGAADPSATRVFWAYKSLEGATGLFDTMLCYDYGLERWTEIVVRGEYIASLAKPGLTLENLDTIAPGTIAISGAVNRGDGKIRLTVATIDLPAMPAPADGAHVPTQIEVGMRLSISGVVGTTEANGYPKTVLAVPDSTHVDIDVMFANAYVSGGMIAGALDAMVPSLDSFPAVTLSALSGIHEDHTLGFFNGANLEAQLDTADQGGEEDRIRFNALRPDTDAPIVYCSVGGRENLQSAPQFSTETLVNRKGLCPARVSTRYARMRARIPYDTDWTFIMGIEPTITKEGKH